MFAVIIIILLVFFGWGQAGNSIPPLPAVIEGNFLASCISVPCQNQYTCDGITYQCKLQDGEFCTNGASCSNGSFCSGRCVPEYSSIGGLNDYCPCDNLYTCILQTDGYRTCKGGGGAPCTNNLDCAGASCNADTGLCRSGRGVSLPCLLNTDCLSLNCNDGFCQNGQTTGQLGSACASPCVPYTGSVCAGGLSCLCNNGEFTPGTCVAATQGLLDICTSSLLCSGDLSCYGNSGGLCSGTGTCSCIFNNPNPNVPEGFCISDMTLVGDECLNNSNLGCDTGGLCTTTCGGASVVTAYSFSRGDVNLRNNFPTATITTVSRAFPGPGVITPYKMFTTSNGDIDTIYLVDHNLGLWSIQYDAITATVVSPWIELIPYSMTIGNRTLTLIDAGYNGVYMIVAFSETVGTVTADTVYTFGDGELTPFNVTTGLPGTQYFETTALSIDYIDISPSNPNSSGDDVLIGTAGAVYRKLSSSSTYIRATVVGGPNNGVPITYVAGPPRFYFDINGSSANNISFVGTITPVDVSTLPQALQFSGSVAGFAAPVDPAGVTLFGVYDYDIHSPDIGGMAHSGTIMLCRILNGAETGNNVVALSYGGSVAFVPQQVGTSSKSAATASTYYVISTGSCS